MLKTYKAQIKKDSIQWVDDKPEELNKEDTLFAYVTIIQSNKNSNQSPKSLVDFFRNSPLFDSGIDLGRDKDTGREVIL